MAASGPLDDAVIVAQWLYRFGTVPRSPAIERDFGPDDDPMGVLGISVGGVVRRKLETAYEASSFTGWYSFARVPAHLRFAPACKLYVSPKPEALADAFPRIVHELVRSEVRSFKVGRGIEGLMRPDKIVAYFEERTHMDAVSRALQHALDGCPAQGVPFTTDVAGNGLLSSGIDPPAGEVAQSWRSWITARLAGSLVTHRAFKGDDLVGRVLADLRTTEIDTKRWHPTAETFRIASNV